MSTPNSLGIHKSPADTRVVVAMSGGVDSSVAAALLHEQGYEVIGVTLQLYDMGETPGEAVKTKTCCAGQDIYDAKRVAENCGFAHYVLNYESKFKESVIDDFADSYIQGQTPIPCVRCNQSVKFRDLLKVAHDLGADCMATGHYIKRTINNDGTAELHRAHDHGKDQSYFLFATTQTQLDFLRFPLGGWSKDKTRIEAERLGLLTAAKPDSQDICFVPHGDYAKVVKKLRPEAEKPGNIVDQSGRILGSHNGIIHYTIGQRRGIGIGGGVSEDNSRFYVIKIDPSRNEVIIGPKDALSRNILHLDDCNWLLDTTNLRAEKGCPFLPVMIKFRSTMPPTPAALNTETNEIRLEKPQYGIAPGQAAVCYINDRVIGGGWIVATDSTAVEKAA